VPSATLLESLYHVTDKDLAISDQHLAFQA